MSGRANDWSELEPADVVIALPNSISLSHYDESKQPPRDLFDVIIVDEANHAPAETWRAVLDHFTDARSLLLTARVYRELEAALSEGLSAEPTQETSDLKDKLLGELTRRGEDDEDPLRRH